MLNVFVLMRTFDPYDLQWGVSTYSEIVGVFSTFDKAQEAFNDCKKHLTNIEEDEIDDYAYGDCMDDSDHNGEHVEIFIVKKTIDFY